MRCLFALAALATATSVMAWIPPEKPDAQQILNEAREDRVAGRNEDALQKHLWFHHEVMKHEPAMAGVRGSFAIADWGTLADRYPPAMQALRKERADAAAAVEADRDTLGAFLDVAAIDGELEDYRETHRLFVLIESRDEALARRVYRSAQEALIEVKDFARCGKYLDPDDDLRLARDMRKGLDRPGVAQLPQVKEISERHMRDQVSRTVALLVLGGRNADAQKAATKIRAEFADPQLEPLLVRALEGQMPPPLITPEQKAMWKKMRR